MTQPFDQDLARQERRGKVADRYLHGFSQREIADELGVSQGTVSNDLKAVREEWRSDRIDDAEQLAAQELAKIDNLEREAWAAWRRSQNDAETVRTTGDETITTKRTQYGDPRFLQAIGNCIERRCKLLGLEAPLKVAETDAQGRNLSPEEARNRLKTLLEAFKARGAMAEGRDSTEET